MTQLVSTTPGKDRLVELIADTLTGRAAQLAIEFSRSKDIIGVRHVAIDDLLPDHIAYDIASAFPAGDKMRLMKSFREQKFTSKAYDQFDPILGDITFALQDPRIVSLIEDITGIKGQIPDSLLYAGGLSAMGKGHFLSPHIDNSHDSSQSYYRTLNLLYYVTPNWVEDNGGNLQIWNGYVSHSITIHSKFNRLVLMETTPYSWHSVSQVKVNDYRKCVSNYYFSKISPTGSEYFNITSFSAPPEQPLLRFLSKIDAGVRQFVRKLKPEGVGPVDVYTGPPR